MKISIFGMLPFSKLIKEGFEKLGHEISNEKPDLIYANDPRGYNEAVLIKRKLAFKLGKEYKKKFSKISVAENIINILK